MHTTYVYSLLQTCEDTYLFLRMRKTKYRIYFLFLEIHVSVNEMRDTFDK